MSGWRVPDEWLEEAVELRDAGRAPCEAIRDSVASDDEVRRWRPEARVTVDPRTGVRTVYSPARARRPHDHPLPTPPEPKGCVVCEGRTTGVLDVAPLSRGHTFVNKNLFPVVFPHDEEQAARGVHLLQWVSTEHDVDLHNIGPRDLAVVLSRLAVMEDRLYRSGSGMPEVAEGRFGHVGIIKNVGRLVGGSLAHGHQQIVHTNVLPRALELDAEFLERAGEPFSRMILRKNPPELSVREYGDWFRTLVPWFMKRPLDMLVVAKDPDVVDLRDLPEAALFALSRALRDAAESVVGLMKRMGREVAYNLTVHNGVAGGLYLEVLPYTQERGGYEALGLCLCEGTPEDTAERMRLFLEDGGR